MNECVLWICMYVDVLNVWYFCNLDALNCFWSIVGFSNLCCILGVEWTNDHYYVLNNYNTLIINSWLFQRGVIRTAIYVPQFTLSYMKYYREGK